MPSDSTVYAFGDESFLVESSVVGGAAGWTEKLYKMVDQRSNLEDFDLSTILNDVSQEA